MDTDRINTVVCLAFSLVNIILHIFCIILLKSTYHGRYKSPQHLYLANLAVAELSKNLLELTGDIIAYDNPQIKRNMDEITSVVSASFATGVYLTNLSAMFFVTLDRLLVCLKPFRYRATCSISLTKKIILVSWVLLWTESVLISVVLRLIFGTYKVMDMDIGDGFWAFTLYIPAIFSGGYLIFAAIAYTKIAMKYVKSQQQVSSQPVTVSSVFRNSKFYVAVLLLVSFLLLQVFPFLTGFFMVNIFRVKDFTNKPIHVVLYVSLYVSDTFDALIYVFIYAPVRKLTFSMLINFFQRGRALDRRRSQRTVTQSTDVENQGGSEIEESHHM